MQDPNRPIVTTAVTTAYSSPWMQVEEHTVIDVDGSPGMYNVLRCGDATLQLVRYNAGPGEVIAEAAARAPVATGWKEMTSDAAAHRWQHARHPVQRFAKRRVPLQLGPERQGVEEVADQGFGLRAAPVSDGRADGKILLARVPGQQHIKSGQHRRKQRCALAPAQVPQGLGHRGRDFDRFIGACGPRLPGARPVGPGSQRAALSLCGVSSRRAPRAVSSPLTRRLLLLYRGRRRQELMSLGGVRGRAQLSFQAAECSLVLTKGREMYVRASWGKLKPGSWDEYERAYKDAVGAGGSVAGLRGRVLARDLDDPDGGYTISFWDDEESMRAHEDSPQLSAMLKELEPYFSGEYTMRRCEVRMDDLKRGS